MLPVKSKSNFQRPNRVSIEPKTEVISVLFPTKSLSL